MSLLEPFILFLSSYNNDAKYFFRPEKYVNTLIVTWLTLSPKKRVYAGVVSLEKLVSLQARKKHSGIGLQYFKYYLNVNKSGFKKLQDYLGQG